jgi:hypothetical protein
VPTSFFSPNLVFDYPGRKFKDMRAGVRWKGNLGDSTNYSLVYLYTHQFSPPIPDYGYYGTTDVFTLNQATNQIERSEGQDSTVTREIVLKFPRQHIAGFSLEQSIPALATILRVEAAVEPNRTFAARTDRPNFAEGGKLVFLHKQMPSVNYAIVLQRPTMIRWLNPTQNFLLVAQFFHSVLPTYNMKSTDPTESILTNVPGYNGWKLQKHTYRIVAVARTSYMHGLINVGLTGMYMPNPYAKDSGFYSVDVGFRIGPTYRLNVILTDFVGKDPYRDLGLFRDRDEVAANFTVLF